MDRRTFLTEAAVLAALSGVSIRVTGCSEDSSPTGNTGGNGSNTPNVPGTVTGTGAGNHPHSVTLLGTHIDSGQQVTLTLTGSGHTHTVTLSAQQVMEIGQGLTVQEPSAGGGHDHLVTFN